MRGLGFATHGCDVASDSVVAVTVPCVAVTVPCFVGPEFQAVSMKEHCGCLLDCLVLDVSEPEVIVAYRASAAPLTTPGDDGSALGAEVRRHRRAGAGAVGLRLVWLARRCHHRWGAGSGGALKRRSHEDARC